MKKLFALLLAMMMIFSLAACGNNETPSGSEGDNPGVSQNGGASNKATGGEMVEDADNSKYDEVERLSGIASIGNPKGYTVDNTDGVSDNFRRVTFSTEAETVAQSDLDSYAAAIWNLCIDVADGNTLEYTNISEAKYSNGDYCWEYELNGETIKIDVKRGTGGATNHMELNVTVK